MRLGDGKACLGIPHDDDDDDDDAAFDVSHPTERHHLHHIQKTRIKEL